MLVSAYGLNLMLYNSLRYESLTNGIHGGKVGHTSEINVNLEKFREIAPSGSKHQL